MKRFFTGTLVGSLATWLVLFLADRIHPDRPRLFPEPPPCEQVIPIDAPD